MNAVDTNVLVYAHDPREPEKQAAAISLIESLTDAALLWQVACEYISANKKLEPLGYSREQAWQDVRELRLVWAAVLPSWEVADRAQQLMDRYSLAYWDAMIVAACREAGVTRLYTEDFSGYNTIDGLEVVNPFSPSR
jgi:predicted nucleic acid-binding protein